MDELTSHLVANALLLNMVIEVVDEGMGGIATSVAMVLPCCCTAVCHDAPVIFILAGPPD